MTPPTRAESGSPAYDGATWTQWAVQEIIADYTRSSDTHLLRLSLPVLACNDIQLYLKDESTHPTGSLKHRLARSLFLHGLCSGWIRQGRPVVEASSGSTAVSEAYFCRLLKLPFIAVVPDTTAPAKLEEIEFLGGQVSQVPAASIYERAPALADDLDGHYMDQFTFAEQATDWRGNNNIAESIFQQLAHERYPIPRYIVVGAGTGGTSATIGRYIRYLATAEGRPQLIVADPEGSVFFDYFQSGDRTLTSPVISRIEGIGRPRVERSFIRDVIDGMVRVPDAASIASARFIEHRLGKKAGGSTGTNIFAAFQLASQMIERGVSGSLVTLLCDGGERYRETYYSDHWLREQRLDIVEYLDALERFADSGKLEDRYFGEATPRE
uniref:L-cysteine desulfhydrase Cds1 n=1 Tax=uncultured Gemmatimonadales bacterium HF0770_11C06 TaxID=723616 RepID=E7C6Z4_9BACT|nr:cysteine synthase [uncultured Gemmatimonadales bacterium HF0770_11C06]